MCADQEPDLDEDPTQEQRAAIETLIQSEVAKDAPQGLHPSTLATHRETSFPSSIVAAHENIAQTGAARTPGTGIDTSRYEELDAPESKSDINGWKSVLRRAYTAEYYLGNRAENLRALEEYGKNAWLIGNSQIEDELRTLERELKDTRAQVQSTEEQRRLNQESVRGEMQALSETWQTALGRAIEAEVETEKLRTRALDVRRSKAGG